MKRILGKLAIAAVATLLSLAVALGLGEVAFRLALDVHVPYDEFQVVRFDERLGWSLVPGDYEFFHPRAFSVARISINEHGMRNPPISLAAPRDRRRITVVGDSFVFAAALSEGDKLTDRLQALAGTDVEVVNVSSPGFGTGQQMLWLQDLAARGYEVGDTVVVVFFTNDILDNAGRRYGDLSKDTRRPGFALRDGQLVQAWAPEDPFAGQERPREGRLRLTRPLFWSFVEKRAVVALSRLPGVIGLLNAMGMRIEPPRTPGIINGWYEEGWREMWQVTDAMLPRLRDTVARLGAQRLVIAFLPSPFQIEPVFQEVVRAGADDPAFAAFLEDMERPQRTLMKSCRKHQIECVDLTDAIRDNPTGEPAYFLREGHLNAHGSELAARALSELVVENGAETASMTFGPDPSRATD